jgi:hypothetical protein
MIFTRIHSSLSIVFYFAVVDTVVDPLASVRVALVGSVVGLLAVSDVESNLRCFFRTLTNALRVLIFFSQSARVSACRLRRKVDNAYPCKH